ncbi:hypothetical protein I4U23_010849 [Adineta vaga]|nr:hypothetical protein I4U23_010849 [Adineta vaga]
MFQYKLLIILVFITDGLSKPLETPPERCCFPKRYSAKLQATSKIVLPNGETKTFIYEDEDVHDLENGLIARRGPTNNSISTGISRSHYIFDFNNKVRYTILSDQNLCLKDNIDYPFENCISEYETYVDSSLYNQNGKEILADLWIARGYGLSYRKVSRDTCTVLETTFLGKTGESLTTITSDFVEDIVDRSIFAIPQECNS